MACRISNETYDMVCSLTEGEHPPFESVSEYLYTLILEDLGRRQAGSCTTTEEILIALKNPIVIRALKCALGN